MIQTEDSVEILEVPGQAEGESGSETIGFSTFGAQRINDAQKRRGRPLQSLVAFNTGLMAPAAYTLPTPVAYWGNFITLFDGTIVGGSRLDGLGSATIGWSDIVTLPTAPYPTLAPPVPGNPRCHTRGGKLLPYGNDIASYSSAMVGAAGYLGIDFFFQTSMTNVNFNIIFKTTGFVTDNLALVINKVPQTAYAGGVPVGFQGGFIRARRRPEGYFPGEDGIQIFCRPNSAWLGVDPGWISPVGIAGVANNNDCSIIFNTQIIP